MNDRIFISIAAYRDPELSRTVHNLFARALRPDRLTVAILDQSEKPTDLPAKPRGARIIYTQCHPSESQGACWARAQVQGKLGSEAFYLQIDSHHLFKPGWDQIAREELSACPAEHPILTAYLPPYELKKGRPRINAPMATPMQVSHFDADGIVIYRSNSYHKEVPCPPMPARFLSGHFTFARRDFVERVPYDPELYFYGEESTLAARAFTNGYDLFHPGRTIAWHHYVRNGRPRHWDIDPKLGAENSAWIPLQRKGVLKYRRIFSILPHIAPGDGLGAKRSLADYEAWAGVDHYWQLTHTNTAFAQPPPSAVSPDWAVSEGHLTARVIRVALPPLASVDRRVASRVHIAVVDASLRDAAAIQCTTADYARLQKTGWAVRVRYRIAPLRLVVWPYVGKDWGKKFESHLDLDQVINARPFFATNANTQVRPRSARRVRRRREKDA